MRICIAQTKAKKGDIAYNIENHKKWIRIAISEKADCIFFPELSLTGYEPDLAQELAGDQNDSRLTVFQELSDMNAIVIGVGFPIRSETGIYIGMICIQPHTPKQTYKKQLLHSDELPFFIPGEKQLILTIKGVRVAPAICFESLQTSHAINVTSLHADIYMASVAKSQSGLEKAYIHYPTIATQYSMPVLMVNAIGRCDTFDSVGQSAVWDTYGNRKEELSSDTEGLLIFDTNTLELIKK
ncbi:carbon-nitrogen hydrolase family protein [Aquimarina hainanensis]|uniref:Carbon-nitrogen hydrolase family protein n=1 Tax=Aquimarina hainanensis TaxID=1578017 RepID=A0ABW5N6B1_9FLAO